MTDNSDFMSRYLPPENAGHREHAASADERAEEVSLSDLRLPEPGAPQSPQMPPPAPLEFAPPGGFDFAPPPCACCAADGGRRHSRRSRSARTGTAACADRRSPRSARRLRRRPSLRSVRRRMPGTRTRCPGRRRRALSCQRVAARPATRRLRSRRARSLTSPTRCRPRRSGGHRRALTLRNAGRRGRTFGLPARHPPGMSRSKRS